MLCEKCEDEDVIPEHDPTASECGHSTVRAGATLCERCSTKKRRCQSCGKSMPQDPKNLPN